MKITKQKTNRIVLPGQNHLEMKRLLHIDI